MLGRMRGYAQVAGGLTGLVLERAASAARDLVAGSGPDRGSTLPGHVQRQMRVLAGDVASTGAAGRDLLVGVVRAEVERAVARFGLVTGEEAAALRRKVERLEQQVTQVTSEGRAAAATPSAAARSLATPPRPRRTRSPRSAAPAAAAPVLPDATPPPQGATGRRTRTRSTTAPTTRRQAGTGSRRPQPGPSTSPPSDAAEQP